MTPQTQDLEACQATCFQTSEKSCVTRHDIRFVQFHSRGETIPDSPGRVALIEFLEALLVLECVHALPEALGAVCQQGALFDQSLKRLPNQLLPRADVAKDFVTENEEAAVDPYIRTDLAGRSDLPCHRERA